MDRRTTLALFVAAVLACGLGDASAQEDASSAADLQPASTSPALTPDLGAAPEAVHLAAAAVQLGERRLCVVRLGRAGETAEERARRASRALEQVVEEGKPADVRVAAEGDVAVVYAGTRPLIQLTREDAAAAGDGTTSVHAEECAAAVREGLRTELRRRTIANLVFSISLIVFSGLLAFLLIGVVSRAAIRVSGGLEARAVFPSLRIGSLELMTPAAMRVAISTAIGIAKPLAQLAIVCSWILSSLSLLPATQPLGHRLTGFVLTPLAAVLGRFVAALPVLLVVAVGAFVLLVLLRFLTVFFGSVAQGDIHLHWLTPEQAIPASVVARTIAVAGALLATPLLTGDASEWGALRIAGVALMVAIVLAIAPALANTAVGTVGLFSRRLQLGAFLEIGPHAGRLVALTLNEMCIEDRSGATVRVPYLVTLITPLRVLGESLPSHYEVTVDAHVPQGPIRKALADALLRQGRAAHVELTEIDGATACYRVVGSVVPGEEDLASAIADALTRIGVPFGRIRKLDIE